MEISNEIPRAELKDLVSLEGLFKSYHRLRDRRDFKRRLKINHSEDRNRLMRENRIDLAYSIGINLLNGFYITGASYLVVELLN